MQDSVPRAHNTQTTSCYMCETAATSNEHAPPKCLFPEGHRIDLITVPSCDTHNSEKCMDDEYMRLVISGSHTASAEGHQEAFDKAIEGLKRRPHLFKEFFFKGPTYPAIVDGQPTMGFTVDYGRFTNALEHTARAVYFHHFKVKWSEQLRVLVASGVFPPDRAKAPLQNARVLALAGWDPGTPKFGDNPEIFFYQSWTDASPLLSTLRMVFYGGFVVFVVPLSRMKSSPFAGAAPAPSAP